MNALLLLAVLAAPGEVVTFVQSGCDPCQRQHAEVGAGDDDVAARYVNCDQFLPEGVTGFPATYHPRTRRMHIGKLTRQELKAWVFESQPLATGAAAHTPMIEVTRVIKLLPSPQVAFVDYGCGYDARWCVAAAEEVVAGRWRCRVVGVEIDSARAAAARERIRQLGLSHIVTIIEGDATTVDVHADVGVAYLYPEVLVRMRPRLERLRVFASYLHQPPMQSVKNGDTFIYTLQVQQHVYQQSQGAVWGGRVYYQPQCSSPNCQMCNAIRSQLGGRR